MRVLLLDRTHPGHDTLSTHALMRAGVVQLDRWGVLPRILAAGTPPVTATTFHYADRAETVALREPLYAPRRPVLDTALLTAALEAGVEARFGADVTELVRDRSGRVTGVRFRVRGPRGGEHRAVPRSPSARTGCAPASPGPSPPRPPGRAARRAPACTATGRRGRERLRVVLPPGATAGIIPTNDGQVCVWAGLPAAAFAAGRARRARGVVRRRPRPDGPRCRGPGRRRHRR